jgi:hypothetical protein
MIARACGLRYRCPAFGEQPGVQHARLDLGAGHGQDVVDGAERAAFDLERRELALAGVNARAHLRKRRDDALHGPARKRFVSENPAAERLGRQNAGEHADGGAGIARVQIR